MILILMFVVNVSYMVGLGEIKMAKIVMPVTVDPEDLEKVEELAKIFGFSKSQIVRIALRLLFRVGIFQALRILEDHE